MSHHRLSLPVATTALLCAFAAAAAGAATPAPIKVDRRVASTGTTAVSITNVAGSIRVTSWERPEVQVTGEIGTGVERLDVLRDGSSIVVKVVLPRGKSSRDSSANLSINVPRSHDVEVSTVSADIDAAKLGKRLEVQTVSGDLRADCDCTEVALKSVSGDTQLTAAGRTTRVEVDTVSGDLLLRGVAGDLEVASISGDVQVAAAELGELRVRTTSGDVLINGRAGPRTAVQIDTVSGDSRIEARGATGLDIDARSFSGEINTCFGARGEPTSKYGPGSKLNLKRGDGSTRLRLGSVSGDMTICDR